MLESEVALQFAWFARFVVSSDIKHFEPDGLGTLIIAKTQGFTSAERAPLYAGAVARKSESVGTFGLLPQRVKRK